MLRIGPPERMNPDTAGLVEAITHGAGAAQRRALAKAITLLESSLTQDRDLADIMLSALLPRTGKALRLGVSGVPGVGKSTFIEALGLNLIRRGHREAVLAVDPSSALSGGSILGDKTRMERLSVHAQAFIRPSPSAGHPGGVAECTRESMLVCEAAGYDVVIVETVGVGQSEIAVAGMVDMFALMQLPNAGDELQAIKRGVMEVADIVLVNKSDLDPDAATRAQASLASTVRILGIHGGAQPGDREVPEVLQMSALQGSGIDGFWLAVQRLRSRRDADGGLQVKRSRQLRDWLQERVDAGLKHWFWSTPGIREEFASILEQVQAGGLAASTGARRLLGRVAAPAGGGRELGRAAASALSCTELAELSSAWARLDQRTTVLSLGPKLVVVKRERRGRPALVYRLLDLIAWLAGQPWLRGVPIPGGPHGQADELRRMDELARAGVAVPEVLHVAAGYFVMAYAQGTDLASVLQRDAGAMRGRWKLGLEFLRDVHARGQYLSQAFARNMILSGQRIVALDFEDDPLRKMSLHAAQTRDWLAYLHSTLWMLPLEQAWVVEDLAAALHDESATVRGALRLTARRLGWMRKLPADRARWGRDVVSLRALALVMVRLQGRFQDQT